eukprot:gene5646-7238_t
MNVLVVGKFVSAPTDAEDVRHSIPLQQKSERSISNQQRQYTIESHGDVISAGHHQCRFNKLFDKDTSLETTYEKVCRPLVESFTRGFNTAVLFLSQQDDTPVNNFLKGEWLIFVNFTSNITTSDDAETIRDMFAPDSKGLRTTETSDMGWIIRNLSTTQVKNSSACISAFQMAFAERETDPNRRSRSCFCFHVALTQGDIQASFRVITLPTAECLLIDPARARLTHGTHVVQGPVSFRRLVSTLTSQDTKMQTSEIIDSSVITRLIGDTLGNNCQTAVIALIRDIQLPLLPEFIELCSELRQKIRNFPVQNTSSLRGLADVYRSAILAQKTSTSGLLQGMGLMSGQDHDIETKFVESNLEILKLKDINAKYDQRLTASKNEMDTLANEKKQLITELLDSEEERLLLTKTMLEMQLAHVNQQGESQKRENDNASLEQELDILQNEAANLREKLVESKNDIASLEVELEKKQREVAALKGGTLALDEEFSLKLRSKISKIVKSKIKLLEERDALTREIVALEGHPQDPTAYSQATKTSVDNTKSEAEEILGMILQRTRIESKEHDMSVHEDTQPSTTTKSQSSLKYSDAQQQSQFNQLKAELTALQEEMKILQQENKRMSSTHDSFIQDQRKRIEKHIKNTTAWMANHLSLSPNESLAEMKALFEETTEEERHSLKTRRLQRLLGIYRSLRIICEENEVPVPSSERFEDAQLLESAEIARLRIALRKVHSLYSSKPSTNAEGNPSTSGDDLKVFTLEVQRKLEDERSRLLVAMTRAEQKIKVMENFIRTKLKAKAKAKPG